MSREFGVASDALLRQILKAYCQSHRVNRSASRPLCLTTFRRFSAAAIWLSLPSSPASDTSAFDNRSARLRESTARLAVSYKF